MVFKNVKNNIKVLSTIT